MVWTVACVVLYYPNLLFNDWGTHCFGFWDCCLLTDHSYIPLWVLCSAEGNHLAQGCTQYCAGKLVLRKQSPEIVPWWLMSRYQQFNNSLQILGYPAVLAYRFALPSGGSLHPMTSQWRGTRTHMKVKYIYRMLLLHSFTTLTSSSIQTCFPPSYRHFHGRALINFFNINFHLRVCFQGTRPMPCRVPSQKTTKKLHSLPSQNIFPKNEIYILGSKKWMIFHMLNVPVKSRS